MPVPEKASSPNQLLQGRPDIRIFESETDIEQLYGQHPLAGKQHLPKFAHGGLHNAARHRNQRHRI